MAEGIFNDICSMVSGPSRYLGTEVNAVHKPSDAVKLRIALAFPDTYDIGTSHFGMQILYSILNRHPEIAAERVFAPGLDMAAHLRGRELPLFSLESRSPLKEFDILGFSLLYELTYTNVLAILDLAGIPFRSCSRTPEHPLVIAGGPCTVNPEPMAEFFDAMVVGDGEQVLLEMAEAWLRWSSGKSRHRLELLESWSDIEGVYIPSFFHPGLDEAGFETLSPLYSGYSQVTRAVVPDLDKAHFPDRPVVPFGKPVHDRLRIEIARGCSRGCRFCQAGMIYRPVRERSLSNLTRLCESALDATGYDDLSLLSLSTGDYSCLAPLMKELVGAHQKDPVALSLPSFRAGTLSPEMMTIVRKVRKTGFTIAPEAGSERLRRVINKNITEAEILDTVAHAFDLGWRLVKLYFMIGLPLETDADIEAIVDLVEKIRRRIRRKGRKGRVNVSLATFVPKPHTPFQWEPQLPVEKASSIIEYLRGRLSAPGVQVKWQDPEISQLEGLWSRGGRDLSGLLEAAYQRGCQFDGWSDGFDYETWLSACRDCGVNLGRVVHRSRGLEERLPWDIVDSRVCRAFLLAEREKAEREALTPDCRFDSCTGCGVCDESAIHPRLAAEAGEKIARPAEASMPEAESEVAIRLCLRYAKHGTGRYFGQLELVSIFARALRRAGIQMQFSRGFHPKPRISFQEALPVGIESEAETVCLTLAQPIECERLLFLVNRELPEGIALQDCTEVPLNAQPGQEAEQIYEIRRKEGGFATEALEAFHSADSFRVERWHPKKKRYLSIDLKAVVRQIQQKSDDCIVLRLQRPPGGTVRPGDVVGALFGLPRESVQKLHIVKKPLEG